MIPVLFVMIVLAGTFFIIADLVPICRNREWKVFWVYTVMMALVLVLAALKTSGVDLPSPAKPLENMVDAIFNIKAE